MYIDRLRKINSFQLWRRWVLATIFAALLGWIISQALWVQVSNNVDLNLYDSPVVSGVPVCVWEVSLYILFTGCIGALCQGGFQYLILRRLAPPFGWGFWATATPPLLIALGKAMYYVVYDVFLFRPFFDLSDNLPYIIRDPSQLTELAVTGFMVALLQYLVLRKVTHRTGWWIPAGAAVYFPIVIANLISRYIIIEQSPENLEVQTYWFFFVLVSGINCIIFPGGLLGWLLVWLLKRPPPLAVEMENQGE